MKSNIDLKRQLNKVEICVADSVFKLSSAKNEIIFMSLYSGNRYIVYHDLRDYLNEI